MFSYSCFFTYLFVNPFLYAFTNKSTFLFLAYFQISCRHQQLHSKYFRMRNNTWTIKFDTCLLCFPFLAKFTWSEIYKSFVYHMMSFDKCFHPCNPNPILIENINYPHPRKFLSLSTPYPPRGNHYSDIFLLEFILPVFYVELYSIFLYVKLILFIICLRFIHAVSSIIISSLFIASMFSIVLIYINIPLFIYFYWWHVGSAVNILVYKMCFYEQIFSLLMWKYLGLEMLDLRVGVCWVL